MYNFFIKPKPSLLWLYVLLPINLFAQQFIEGKVITSKNEALPYALIYYPNSEIGTMSDDMGKFKIKYISDTSKFVISLLGFESIKTSVLNNNYKFEYYLESKNINLNEIIVKPSKSKKEINLFSANIADNRNYNICDSLLPYNFELGLKFTTNIVSNIKGFTVYISNESTPKTPFRFNIYQIDTIQNISTKISSLICNKYYKNKLTKVYLENILTLSPGHYLFSIEWLTSEFNSNNLFQIKTKNNTFNCYGPSIYLAKYKDKIGFIKRNNSMTVYNKKSNDFFLGPAIDIILE